MADSNRAMLYECCIDYVLLESSSLREFPIENIPPTFSLRMSERQSNGQPHTLICIPWLLDVIRYSGELESQGNALPIKNSQDDIVLEMTIF